MVCSVAGCGGLTAPTPAVKPDGTATSNLLEVRGDFETVLVNQLRDEQPLPPPHPEVFSLIEFSSDAVRLSAYLSKPTDRSTKQAAIVWITGGFPASGIDASAWQPADPSNDQSAKVYRERGMVMMYPALRGCFGSDGFQEGFYGEVNDIIAAGEYLKSLDYIDPDRIFLGGHSTGGTLVLLVAEATDLFRGVISFGPVEDPFFYGPDTVNHSSSNERERTLRAPINFLDMINTPTIVVEGDEGNISSLRVLRKRGSSNSNLSFVEVPGVDHFAVLAQVNNVLAGKVVNLKAGEALTLSATEL